MKLHHLVHLPTPAALPAIPHQTGSGRRTFLRALSFLAALGLALPLHAQINETQNPPEVAGFRGQVTGTVKSAQAEGHDFVLAITKAEADPAASTLKEGAPLLGKELTIGVRMPKNAEGVASRHPDDVVYIKTLKPGMVITVKIFAVHSNPRILRIQSPGQRAGG